VVKKPKKLKGGRGRGVREKGSDPTVITSGPVQAIQWESLSLPSAEETYKKERGTGGGRDLETTNTTQTGQKSERGKVSLLFKRMVCEAATGHGHGAWAKKKRKKLRGKGRK